MIRSFFQSLFKLKSTKKVPNGMKNLESKEWNIDSSKLRFPSSEKSYFNEVQAILTESPNKKYACLFYAIHEYRMCAYSALIAVYKDKANPVLIFNPSNQWFDFNYSEIRNVFFLTTLCLSGN